MAAWLRGVRRGNKKPAWFNNAEMIGRREHAGRETRERDREIETGEKIDRAGRVIGRPVKVMNGHGYGGRMKITKWPESMACMIRPPSYGVFYGLDHLSDARVIIVGTHGLAVSLPLHRETDPKTRTERADGSGAE